MTRDLTTLVSNSLDQAVVTTFFAVDIDFDSEPLYVWNGYGDLVIDGKTYLGAGQLLGISTVEETTEMEAKGASLTLSGVPSLFLAAALTQPYQGRECRIYFGVFKSPVADWILQSGFWDDTGIWYDDELWNDASITLSDYVEVFSGELDQMNIVEAADTATIQVTAENVLVRLERPVVRRFTDQDQKSRYPGDLGLEFVAGLQDKEIFWGRVAK
jgi:hypothetical protein